MRRTGERIARTALLGGVLLLPLSISSHIEPSAQTLQGADQTSHQLLHHNAHSASEIAKRIFDQIQSMITLVRSTDTSGLIDMALNLLVLCLLMYVFLAS